MKVLAMFGMGEPPFATARSLVRGLKEIGCRVTTCGPSYDYMGYENWRGDFSLPDREYPEYYSYEEVIAVAGDDWDLFLQIEPHFNLEGQKPDNIISAYYFTDPHRGGWMNRRACQVGSFDHIFCAQPYYAPLFEGISGGKVHAVDVGFEPARFLAAQVPPVCDIAFVGETGISEMIYDLHDVSIGDYATHPPVNLPTDHERFQFHDHLGFDYAVRAELLIRLSKDFNVRFYKNIWDTPNYQMAMQSGKICFNRSLLNDINIRCFEAMACSRPLVTDRLLYLPEIIGTHAWRYDSYYNPLFQNFDLEYEQVQRMVESILKADTTEIVGEAREYVWEAATWKNRAEELIGLL